VADVSKRRTVQPPTRIDVALTLGPLRRGIVDPTMSVEPGEVWRATRTPEGPATVRLRNRDDEIVADAWGPGADWALDQVEELVGMHDDPGGFAPVHPRLREVARRLTGLRIARSRRVVEVLVPTVVEQRVQGMEARRSYRGLVTVVSDPAPGPTRLMLPPDPDVLARMPYYEFHRFGIERRRADVVRALCRSAARLEEACDMAPEAALRRLTAISGLGPWTAAYCLRLALGDPDSVIVGDYNLPGVVAWFLAGERTAADGRMLELLEPFKGQRGRVMLLIEASGVRPPRRAPRARASQIAHL
jgi:3-methyladenine DNA glycosylase/8-oxoguanine DNA glycosylase